MALELIIVTAILLVLPDVQGQRSDCYNKLTKKTGIITSPGYPHDYPPNSLCEYILRSAGDYYIELTFTNFKLEQPSNGLKTDYITVFDGGANNRRQSLTFNGSHSAPFTIRSETNRLLVTFYSDRRFAYSGFRAKYRHLKKCQPISVEHGQVDCDVNKLGLVSHCNVTCDKKFTLVGERRVQCMDGKFPNKPTCVVRPEYACTSQNFRDIFKKTSKTWWITLNTCDKDETTGEISKCNYECANNYVDTGNGTIECIDGVIENEAQCSPDPDVIEKCLEADNTSACPLSDQDGFTAILEEDSKRLEEVGTFGRVVGGNSARTYRCDKQVCRRMRSGRYYWSCPKYAKVCQLVFKESQKTRRLRNTICGKCQKKGCRGRGLFTTFYKP